jgi:hypothetical protein
MACVCEALQAGSAPLLPFGALHPSGRLFFLKKLERECKCIDGSAMSESSSDCGSGRSVDEAASPTCSAIARVAFIRSEPYNELACTLQHLGKS